MAKFVTKYALVYFNEFDISGVLNQIEGTYSADLQEDTAFNDDTRSRLSGLVDATFTLNGFWDDSEDAEYFSQIGANAAGLLSIVPNSEGTDGDDAFTMKVEEASYSPGASVGEIFAVTMEFSGGDSPLVKGRLFHTGSESADGDGTTITLPAVGANERVFAALHVISNSGNGSQTLDVKVVSDDDGTFDSASTDQITFTQVGNSNTFEMLSANGAISDTNWRVEWTIDGDSGSSPSFSFLVIVGVTDK